MQVQSLPLAWRAKRPDSQTETREHVAMHVQQSTQHAIYLSDSNNNDKQNQTG
jgi:hypothetical protein